MTAHDQSDPWLDALLATTKQVEQLRAERDEAIRERDEARRERDSARRWICRDRETHSISAQEIADANNWDCFRETDK